MNLKTFVAHLVRKYRIKTPYERIEDVRIAMDLVMKPVEGYKIILECRE